MSTICLFDPPTTQQLLSSHILLYSWNDVLPFRGDKKINLNSNNDIIDDSFFFFFFSTTWTSRDCRLEAAGTAIAERTVVEPDPGARAARWVADRARTGPCDSSEWGGGARATAAALVCRSCSSEPVAASDAYVRGQHKTHKIHTYRWQNP